MLPTFVIIGAMKGGTTSLYHYLDEHPEICMSRIKETDYFVAQKNYSKGLAWYCSLFTGDGKEYGEASPNYSMCHVFEGVAERMHASIPKAKLIYVLRDPIERIISHYVHNYARGRESRPLCEALQPIEPNKYVLTSMYFMQLTSYLRYFPEENIYIAALEELKRDARNVMQDLFRFLGVDPSFQSERFGMVYHQSSNKKRRSVLERKVEKRYVRRLLGPLLPSSLVQRVPFERPQLDETTKEKIRDYLRPDVERLRSFSGKRFSEWNL